MTEQFATPSATALLHALTDSTMLEPSGIGTALLFDPAIFDIHLQAEGSINNSGLPQFVVPLTKVMLILQVPYGKRQSYMTLDTAEDWQLSMKFRAYGNNGSDMQDLKTRIEFASLHRLAVLSSFGIYDFGIDEHPRIRPYDERLGFATLEYTVRYRWTPDA